MKNKLAPKNLSNGKDDLLEAIRSSGVASLRRIQKDSPPKKQTADSVQFKTLAELKKQPSKGSNNDLNARPVDLAEDLKSALKSFRSKVSRNSISDIEKDDDGSGWSNSGSINNSLVNIGNENVTKSTAPVLEVKYHRSCDNNEKSQETSSLAQKEIKEDRNAGRTSQSGQKGEVNQKVSDGKINPRSSLEKIYSPCYGQESMAMNIELPLHQPAELNSFTSVTQAYSSKIDHNSTANGTQPSDDSNSVYPLDSTDFMQNESVKISPGNSSFDGGIKLQNAMEESYFCSKYEVEALYDFSGVRSDDLSFNMGDTITVLQEHGEWLYGTSCRSTLSGWFPKNYTEVRRLDFKPQGNLKPSNYQKDIKFFMISERKILTSSQ